MPGSTPSLSRVLVSHTKPSPALLVVTIAVLLPPRRGAGAALLTLPHFWSNHPPQSPIPRGTGYRRHLYPRRVDSPICIKVSSERVRRLLLRLSPSGWSPSAPCTVVLEFRVGDPRTRVRIHRLCSGRLDRFVQLNWTEDTANAPVGSGSGALGH